MMEQLIQFETAKLAREKGFNYKTYNFTVNADYKKQVFLCFDMNRAAYPLEATDWNNFEKGGEKGNTSIPTQSQLQTWLREVHDIRICINFDYINASHFAYTYRIIYNILEGKGGKKYSWEFYEEINSLINQMTWYNKYEDCLEQALLKGLKLIR